jgi:hypothetical protein
MMIVQQNLRTPNETGFLEVLYPCHPWAGLRVGVHKAARKTGGIAFRCTLSGRQLESPAWMFDRSVGTRVRASADPYVELAALVDLTELLRSASSNTPLSSDCLTFFGSGRLHRLCRTYNNRHSIRNAHPEP